MDTASLILDYLKVVLSTPVVIGAIAIVALLVFKTDIKTLISRIATIRLPGGSELSTSQQARSSEEAAQDRQVELPQDVQIPLLDELQLSQEQIEALRQLYLAERANAYLWEYRFLNFYLVPASQYVLEWFATVAQPASLSLFDNVWTPSIPSAEEREAIIGALQAHHLVAINEELVQVTPKGREYIEWRGPMPRPAT